MLKHFKQMDKFKINVNDYRLLVSESTYLSFFVKIIEDLKQMYDMDHLAKNK